MRTGLLAGAAVLALVWCGVLLFHSAQVVAPGPARPGGEAPQPCVASGVPDATGRAAPTDEPSEPTATRRVDRLPGDPASYRVTLSFPDPEVASGPDGSTVSVAGQTGRAAPGMPDLPVYAWAMAGVPNRSMRVRMLRSVVGVSMPDVQLAPVPTRDMARGGVEPPSVALVSIPDAVVSSRDAPWPEDIVTVTEAWMGTRKLARVAVYPVQYNPVRHHLRAYGEVEFVLEYVPSAHPETQRGPK